jgi:hypothetical protein
MSLAALCQIHRWQHDLGERSVDEEVLPDRGALGFCVRPGPVEDTVTKDRAGPMLSPQTRSSSRHIKASIPARPWWLALSLAAEP